MNYAQRRNDLLEMLPEYSIAVLFAGSAPHSIGDEKYPFKVNRSFYYYTGLDYENLVLMLVKYDERTTETLYIEHFDPQMAKWVGGKVLPEEAKETSGIEDIRYVEDIEDDIFRIVNYQGSVERFALYGDLSSQYLTQPNSARDLFKKISEYHPDVEICNISSLTSDMRSRKDEDEIALMKQAIDVTRRGIETMMANARPYIWENELEAYFDFVLKCEQCEHAFGTICGSGKNATILHYGKNNTQAGEDDLVLCDLGAAYKNYNADITRTFPVSGRFTERQAQIYDIVLRGNKLIESKAKPGETTRTLNGYLLKFYQEELGKIGLLENGKTVRDYYWHGVSHHLGLETHDVSVPGAVLQPGCVITNEPGLYLEEEGIGIRIEDDLLITEDGCINLSKDIIKEIEDIENFMKK